MPFSQKPIIDSVAIINWPLLSSNYCSISNDGNYFSYRIENLPEGRHTQVIQKTNNSWKKEFPSASFCFFTEDNKQAVYQNRDSLIFLSLKSGEVNHLRLISNYKRPKNTETNWLAYQPKDVDNTVVLRHLLSGKEEKI